MLLVNSNAALTPVSGARPLRALTGWALIGAHFVAEALPAWILSVFLATFRLSASGSVFKPFLDDVLVLGWANASVGPSYVELLGLNRGRAIRIVHPGAECPDEVRVLALDLQVVDRFPDVPEP
jgi:hypothetical protein